MKAIYFKNRSTKVSDQGLAALGSSLKDLKRMTNLSLIFEYYLKDYFSQFQTYLRAVFLVAPEVFEFEFCIFINFFSTSFFTQRIAISLKNNRSTQVSDECIVNLGYSLKDLKNLTDLSLNFRFF